jgi:hypothetical protein
MPARMYLVELRKKKLLIEAISVEAAIKTATAPMVKSCTIPTPLEVARLIRDGVETIAPSVASPQPAAGAGPGLGLVESEENRSEPSETVVKDEAGEAQ